MVTAILQSIFYNSLIVNTHTPKPHCINSIDRDFTSNTRCEDFPAKKDNHDHSDKKYTVVLHIIQAKKKKKKNQAKDFFLNKQNAHTHTPE